LGERRALQGRGQQVTASKNEPNTGRDRRIIERPRLIKLLDESEARIILLLAPAGYGKTTLARQWAKTLNGAVWVSLTPAHRDLARFAETVANGIDRLGGNARGFMSEYLKAIGSPEQAAGDVAGILADQMSEARVQWLILDDLHEVNEAHELAHVLEILEERSTIRLLLTARTRPVWVTPRRTLYGEIYEIPRESLAMDELESRRVLGRRPELLSLAVRAEGWPAVVGLAAQMAPKSLPRDVMPAALYEYLAEEIYRSAPLAIQEQLLGLALAPELTEYESAGETPDLIEQIRALGFLSSENETELHPLIREFLLEKLTGTAGAEDMAREAVDACLKQERWDRAFELVLRFNLRSMVEPVLEAAYGPLMRSGHLGTLSAFTANVRMAPSFPPPVVDLVDADLALRDGAFQLAADLATRVRDQIPIDHPLASRANTIIAQTAFIQADLATSAESYRLAYASAGDARDQADALYGWAVASIQGETGDATSALTELKQRRNSSPLDLVKYSTANFARARFSEGYPSPIDLDETLHALPLVADPRARTSFTYCVVYALSLRAEYLQASELATSGRTEVDAFNLAFARPYTEWNLALVNLGLRRFGAAERNLQRVEDAMSQRPVGFHVLNARILRMRLALQTGELDRVAELMRSPDHESAIPSLHAEHRATQGLCLAVLGQPVEALAAVAAADKMTTAVEVKVLGQAVRAVVAARDRELSAGTAMFSMAERYGAWDPVIAALRASEQLRDALTDVDEIRPKLETLYQRSNDLAFARRAGFRTRSPSSPSQLLSPREMEVLELLARGFRNRDIARALVISDSTTKVHVRHILEKLGVRTRTQAVARLELFR
jgi:LuxR family maltose regulon positive regulatory protein